MRCLLLIGLVLASHSHVGGSDHAVLVQDVESDSLQNPDDELNTPAKTEDISIMLSTEAEDGQFIGFIEAEDPPGEGSDAEREELRHLRHRTAYHKYFGKACRTPSGGRGTNGDEYEVYHVYSKRKCKYWCSCASECKAFEYSYGRCELWYTFPEKVESKHGFVCFVKEVDDPTPSPTISLSPSVSLVPSSMPSWTPSESPTDSQAPSGSPTISLAPSSESTAVGYYYFDGYCRTASGKKGREGHEYHHAYHDSFHSCQRKCSEYSWCMAFEYYHGSCELWKEHPLKYLPTHGVYCALKKV